VTLLQELAALGANIAPITFIGASSQSAGGTVAYPGGAASGDLVVLIINFGTIAPTTPSGFTLKGSYTAAPLYGYRYGIYTKTKAAESSVVTSATDGGVKVLIFRNASNTGAMGSWVQTLAAATTMSVPSVTGGYIVGYGSDRDPGKSIAPTEAGWATLNNAGYTNFSETASGKLFNGATGVQVWNLTATSTFAAVGTQFEVLP